MNPTTLSAKDESFWQSARKQVMLDHRVTQLNAGTCSPTPRAVFDRVNELRRRQAESPTEFQWRETWPLLRASREALAGYLHADQADFALVENVTVGLNLAVRALDLPAGSEILTSDHEYGSMLTLCQRFASERSVTVRVVELPKRLENPEQIVSAFLDAISDRTRVLFFSHISSPTGLVFPAEELCRAAQSHGIITIIDGAHAPGQVPVDLTRIDADFYAANCHKWMMAPASVGFIHANRRIKRSARSIVSSWGHGYPPEQLETEAFPGTSKWQYDLEFHGTSDRCPQMVLPEAVTFRNELGGDEAVFARVRQLSAHLRSRLASLGLEPFLPHDPRLVGNLTAFILPDRYQTGPAFIANPADTPAARLQKRLWDQHKIECPVTFGAGRVFLRVSTGWFNTSGEIDRLAEALNSLV